jgi:hypothetical protein
VGSKIDALHTNREKRRELERQIEKLNSEASLLERELLAEMKDQGLEKATGKFASASLQETMKPQIEDWDRFYAYIHKNKYYHLLERRPSVSGCRELFETKGAIPGVLPITLQKISLRNT